MASKQDNESSYAVSLYEPMFFWILLLYLGLIVKIVLSNTNAFSQATTVDYILQSFSYFVLSTPGFIVLPLIAGAIIGAEVGLHARNMKSALRASLLNSAYAAAIYLVAIIILYEVLNYAFPSTQNVFSVAGWIVVPIVIVVLVTAMFAMLSHARKIKF
jgi:hypothetical protein